MNLYESFYEDCYIMDKVTISDGMGGVVTEYRQGALFKCAIVTKATTQQREAEKLIGFSTFEITTPISILLKFNDIFKRKKDGKYFKVTSDCSDVQTPISASFQFNKCTAQEFEP